MKLQLALDMFTMEEAKRVMAEAYEYVDIIEAGSVLTVCGLPAVKELKALYPDKEVLADYKLPDGGDELSQEAFDVGADYVTVLAVADDATIKAAVKAARRNGRKVVCDMINVKNFAERAKEVDAMGVDVIATHVGTDVQSSENTPFEKLQIARLVVKNALLSVAGGVNIGNIHMVAAAHPDIIICGMGIIGQKDVKAAAKAIREAMDKMEKQN